MKRAFSLIEMLIVVAVLVGIAVVLTPIYFVRVHPSSRRAQCQSNLKQIGLGFIQYVQDNNDKFPPTQNGTSGWVDVIQPYVKSHQLFQCPSTPNKTEPFTDYFFNSRLSRGYTPKIEDQARTILAGEGTDDAPTWANLRQLPPRWLLGKTTPPWRHLDTANYLFADGHVKALKPGAVSSATSKSHAATFAVR